MKLALAQLNFSVGDLTGNAEKILAAAHQAHQQGADVLVTPELALTGYPPEDLLLREDFIRAAEQALARIIQQAPPIALIVGHPQRLGEQLYNAASVIADGRIIASYHKQCLPNHSVFDEKRYFRAGSQACVCTIQGVQIGITICEDAWENADAMLAAKAAGAALIVNLNASPFHLDKQQAREDLIRQRCQQTGLAIVYVNLVGGQDELVFDGASFVMAADGQIALRAAQCESGLYLVNFSADVVPEASICTPYPALEAQIYRVLALGLRDYVDKNGFSAVVIGLSGGIDSALTLAIAADALGAERVRAIMMPSVYTAAMSREDARQQAQSLGVGYQEIPIQSLLEAYQSTLTPAGIAPLAGSDVTYENLQARIRGNLLMAISNRSGAMVVTTGNKSEMAVGYATLYGDMAGGFALIKDLPKTMVYRLAHYRNSIAPVIPARVLSRAPSAELAPGQQDSDTLPAYEILDQIIEADVEQDRSAAEIIALGHDADTVQRVLGMIRRNEYKRRQAPPGVRISARAFGKDRRYPITQCFSE